MGLKYEGVSTEGTSCESNKKSSYDKSSLTRNVCIVGLSVSWILGIGLLVGGVQLAKADDNWANWPSLTLNRY